MVIKMTQNPFSDYGAIVSGSRFVGRESELNRLRQRVLPKEGFGNFAIMGLPRIGKSSLMWQGVMSKEAELRKLNTIVVWFTASQVNDTFFFLRCVCKEIIIKSRRIADDNLKMFLDEKKDCLKDVNNKEEIKEIIDELLEELVYQKIKVILLIDEFDAVQGYMTTDDFGYLRTITYELNKKICIVTTSRKTIKDIETVSGSVSNFFGTFDTLRLGLFDRDSIDLYWQWVESCMPPFRLDNEYKERATYKVGFHPFLLDFFNYCKWLQSETSSNNSDNQDFEIQLKDIFDTMQGTLEKEKIKGTNINLKDAAIQLIVGPVMDVNSDQIKALEAYDFVAHTSSNKKLELLGNHYGPSYEDGTSFVCFSPYLTTLFVFQHLFDIPYWAEWQETEMRVRGIIKKYVGCLGEKWEDQLCSRYADDANWMANYNALKSLRSRSLKRFPKASQDLIDYTLPSNMFSMFIGPAWGDFFANVFLGVGSNRSGNKDEWRQKFQFLSDVRNPVAHSNGRFVDEGDINTAKQFCKAIINAINKWEQRHHS